MTIAFDDAAFRAACPTFSSRAQYPTAVIQAWWDIATNFISANDSACFMLSGTARAYGLNLMAGHIGTVTNAIASGQPLALITEAAVDKVRVTAEPPPNLSQFSWWLSLTPYGQALAALLALKGVGGIYVGGLPERAAFRRAGGGFGG